jgi:cation transport protein ChaC
MPLNRDSLSDDSFKQKMLDEAPGEMELMDADAFEASRQAILREAEETGELWVFGYGSLIWNPIIEVAESQPAKLTGYERRFCVWAPIGRGTPDCPGLWLGLDEGGSCDGQALRIDRAGWDAETLILWRREMISGVYIPVWVPVEIGGKTRGCCVFIANPDHDRYQAEIEWDETVAAIAQAAGSLGTCRAYLESLAEGLEKSGMSDPYIERLMADVRAA